MSTPYLPIQPAPSGDFRRRDQDGHNEKVPRKKRYTRPNACETCRLKKTRCNGAKPSCSMCSRKGVRCVYATNRILDLLVQQPHDYLEILNWVKGSSTTEATSFLQQLMSSSDPTKAVSALQGDMHGRYYPSNIMAARSTSPPTSSALEFELTARHSNVYRPLVPLDTTSTNTSIGFDSLGTETGSPWSDSQDPGPSWNASLSLLSMNSDTDGIADGETPNSSTSLAPDFFGPRLNSLFDQRLHQLDIGYWTSVDIQNELAARIISHYFETNHPSFAFFDPYLFIGDLVNHQLQFCSAWLVNALLAYACLSYSAIDSEARSLSRDFSKMSKILWRAERSTDNEVNLAAVMTFAVSCHLAESDVSAIELLEQGRQMAERLHLFGVEKTDAIATTFDKLSPEKTQFMAYVAWGAYNFLTMNTFYCPVRPVTFPPWLPTPDKLASNRSANPRTALAVPEHGEQTLAELSKLWRIMQEVAAVHFACRLDPAVKSRPPLAFAEARFQKLLYLTDTLPRQLVSDKTQEQAAAFQIMFHSAVMVIFYPFIRERGPQRLGSFSSPLSSVESVMEASTNQLKRLVLTCRLSNSRLLSPALSGTAALHVSNSIIRNAAKINDGVDVDTEGQDWRSYLFQCLAMCRDLAVRFPVFEFVVRGLLAMAIRDGIMAGSEAQETIEILRMGDPDSKAFGGFVIDFGLAVKDVESAQVRALADKFDELTMFDAFTQAQDFVIEDGQIENE